MSLTRLIGKSAWTQALRKNIAQVAGFSSNVLITGPSGTGKELIARSIHEHSPRGSQAFIPVDCTSLTGELFASHLFGHIKGAFTGGDYERLGCFRAAEGGTILLDEIGEMSADLQSKLLRTIQERVVVPVGSDRPIPVDVRIIAATNRDLAEEVRAGRFRLDLFYRLNVVSFESRALRERTEDIEPLADHFLDKLSSEQGVPRKRLSPSAIAALKAYAWPGNVRELQNVLERAAIFATSNEIDGDALPRDEEAVPRFPVASQPAPSPAAGVLPAEKGSFADETAWSSLADVECEHIRATLVRTFYNQSAAARLLRIDRASLARKIERFGISVPVARRGRPAGNAKPGF
jgi:DNA-binding NtrC family response regulator